MITIEITEEEKAQFNYWRYHHPHPLVQRKMEALWLKSQGLAHKEIARLVGVTDDTVTNYLRAYKEGGIEKLKELKFKGSTSALEEHQTTLEQYFREHPPKTSTEARAVIERLTGIQRSPSQVRAFMQRLGMKFIKVGQVPAKADAQAQEEFKKKSWSHV